MPKYARGSDIDLEEAYGDLLADKRVATMRNIRTKAPMHRVHHCEDPECGGTAPKLKCVHKLHFAWCLAPVVDKDPESPTFDEVVIHGERFVVMSPGGCPAHPYSRDYNLDIRAARNDRPNLEVRWKGIVEEARNNHEMAKTREAEMLEARKKDMGMTGHQRRTKYAQQDGIDYQQRQKQEAATRVGKVLHYDQEGIVLSDDRDTHSALVSQPRLTSEEAQRQSNVDSTDPGELAVSIAAVTDEEAKAVLAHGWLYVQLFDGLDAGRVEGGATEDWASLDLQAPVERELAAPTAEWLQAELYPEPDPHDEPDAVGTTGDSLADLPSPDEQATQGATSFLEPQGRRKENKQAKKQRAAEKRARTRADERAKKEAEEEELAQMKESKVEKKSRLRKTGASTFT